MPEVEPLSVNAPSVDSVRRTMAPYFPVSLSKFVVMSFCTFGAYNIYWFYCNWRRLKQRDRSTIWPAWRGIFCVHFFSIQCLARIRNDGRKFGLAKSISPMLLGSMWIVMSVCARASLPYSLISLFAFLPLVPAQVLANQINEIQAPAHIKNDKFTAINIAVIFLFGLIVSLAAVGNG